MFSKSFSRFSVVLLLLIVASSAVPDSYLEARQFPAEPQGVKTITTPSGVKVRYKEPDQEGVCETTPGVKSYAGYIDLAENEHIFFWFFESRCDPVHDPITLWLNGGPGSDSLVGLFQELGPCNVTKDLKTQINPYSWNEVSNLLFISQPVGTGFSYREEAEGSIDPFSLTFVNASVAPPNGRYAVGDVTDLDTTDKAAIAAYQVLQAFYSALPLLDSEVESKEFNLWTESYGGHYGPAFYNYFSEQNALIASGKANGTQLIMNTLGIGNGLIDEGIQIPWYPEFAIHNTYGIKAYNETVYDYVKFALNMPNGCLEQLSFCYLADRSGVGLNGLSGYAICSEAQCMCRDNVEGPYYAFSGRGIYDIRHPFQDPTPPPYFIQYLNQPDIQNALGVDLNYTKDSNIAISFAFQQTGDFVFPNFIQDLEILLDAGVRVSLYYGDADYICNWFGGQAVSLAVNYSHAAEFAKAGYQAMTVDGVEYGEVRQYGNFSFLRVYEAGHEVPFYQPVAALALFNRTINHWNIADGTEMVTEGLGSTGPASATHTEPFVPLPTPSGNLSIGSLRQIKVPRAY